MAQISTQRHKAISVERRATPKKGLPVQPTWFDPVLKREHGTDGTHHRGVPAETCRVAQKLDGIDPGAVGTQDMFDTELLHLGTRPADLFVRQGQQMKATENSVYGLLRDDLPRILHGVHDAGMAAAGQHDQSLRSADHQRLIFGNGVLFERAIAFNLAQWGPVLLWVNPWNGSRDPDARVQLLGLTMNDESTSFCFEGFAGLTHIEIDSLWQLVPGDGGFIYSSRQEDSLPHVGCLHRRRALGLQGPP